LLYILGKHQDVQEKLYQEVIEKIGRDTAPTVENVATLDYMHAVLHENLRLYPPTPIITLRKNEKDVILGDYFVPAGTQLSISIVAIHHNEKYWPNAM